MSADIVNLRQARKRKARQDKDAHAVEQRIRFGRTKAEKLRTETVRQSEDRALAGHWLERPDTPAR